MRTCSPSTGTSSSHGAFLFCSRRSSAGPSTTPTWAPSSSSSATSSTRTTSERRRRPPRPRRRSRPARAPSGAAPSAHIVMPTARRRTAAVEGRLTRRRRSRPARAPSGAAPPAHKDLLAQPRAARRPSASERGASHTPRSLSRPLRTRSNASRAASCCSTAVGLYEQGAVTQPPALCRQLDGGRRRWRGTTRAASWRLARGGVRLSHMCRAQRRRGQELPGEVG